MKLSQSSLSLIEETIKKAICKYTGSSHQTAVTDIHLQPNPSSGLLSVFNDEDEVLAEASVSEWAHDEGDAFYTDAERVLTTVLNELKNTGLFDSLNILKPFSFVLVDEDKETVADLLLMDDDTLLINDELLKGLDQELDDFLKHLLEK